MSPARSSSSLSTRVIAALSVFFILGCIVFGYLVAARAKHDVAAGMEGIVRSTSRDLETIFAEHDEKLSDLLDRAVRQLSDNMGREFEDIPFDVFAGREDLLVNYLKRRVGESRERHLENAAIVAHVIEDVTLESARERFAELEVRNRDYADSLGRRISADLLKWCGILLLGLALGIGVVFWRLVLEPVRSAVEVMESARDRDLSRRIPVRGADEIARLASSFNSMAADLEAYHSGLEAKVAEKTRALTDALEKERDAKEKLASTLKELERTQRGLIESEKMAALGTMAQGMAHEFNNILGGIAGCAADLMNDIDDPEDREVLDVIVRTAKRASVITDNLLRFSRGDARERSESDLADLIRTAIALVRPEATRNGVSIEVDVPEKMSVFTDVRGLQQVLLNVLINALQASTSGQRIEVTAGRSDHGYDIEVRDFGCGIESSALSRVFEPFFTTKEPPSVSGRGGTGLGLSVSLGIMKGLGGTIVAASDGTGKGARFRITVPTESEEVE